MTEPAEKAPAAAPPDLTPEERIAALVRGEGAAAPPPALPPPAANDDLPEDVEDPGEEALPIPGPPVNEEALKRCAGEAQNDTGNAHRLIAHFGGDLVVAREQGWMVWTGTHWDLDTGRQAVALRAQWTAPRIALETREMKPGFSENDEDFEKRRAGRRKFAVSSGNKSRAEAMVALAEPHLTRPVEDFDADPLMVAVENGVLIFAREIDPDCPDPDVTRWRGTVTFRPHRREDLITKVMPVRYDPAAHCPRWDDFLGLTQPKEPVRRFLQVFHGLGLTGRTVQALAFHHGGGANGKSTFLSAIRDLMGSYARELPAESITGQGQRRGDQATPDLALLPGARLVQVSELPRGEPLKEALVKQLIGGDVIQARHLNKGFFRFIPVFKAVMSGNDLPQISGVDHGIWRRIRLVPWEVTIPEGRRREMADVLADFAAERSGILNWLIAGTLAYLAEGLIAPDEVTAATQAYREEMDPIGGFVADCVERTEPGQNASVTAREMYEAYVSWSLANAKRPWKETAFGRAMPHKGFTKTSERVRRYLDCRLHDVPARPDAPPRSPPLPYGDD
ncbi:DNA primase family protein [Xanthobacter tagetidis]|uniref:DNA primase n=1 Tax=Xanthobacter tagetidis TaxID=60216 RepID=A0A3L7AKP7_9HYPH|nr:phage/plasmid primase, P4 family [Xanthobacter tagetidis]MBB6308924.1 putative DNA primase/helicase [Xanthobacter tagetidis]RLP80565.1 DNA primase [Xanthobacter tagetidis]